MSATHLRDLTNCKKAICGYVHRGAGYGLTVESPANVSCKKCKEMFNRRPNSVKKVK